MKVQITFSLNGATNYLLCSCCGTCLLLDFNGSQPTFSLILMASTHVLFDFNGITSKGSTHVLFDFNGITTHILFILMGSHPTSCLIYMGSHPASCLVLMGTQAAPSLTSLGSQPTSCLPIRCCISVNKKGCP